MDIVITFVIILIIVMAVAPFFLLSGEFRGKKGARDDGTGTVTPVPGTGDSAVFPKNRDDSGGADGADTEDAAEDDPAHHV